MKTPWLGLVVLSVVAMASTVLAQVPVLPTIVTGTVTVGGALAPAGRTVTANIENAECGTTTTGSDGTYTLQVGGRPGNPAACDQVGATIRLRVDGTLAPETTTREPATLKTVNLVVGGAPPPITVVSLFVGWNNVQYNGAPRPVGEALGDCLASVNAVFQWSATEQGWRWWLKGAAEGVNTITNLSHGAVIWVLTTSACRWTQAVG